MFTKVLRPLLSAVMLVQLVFLVTITAAGDKPAVMPATDKTGSEDSLQTPDTSGGTPVIFFPEEVYNFGEAPQKTTLTHVFKVLNKGDAPLKLIKVSAS